MSHHDAFAELGLAADASEREVKAAWRRLVSQWHPDRNDSADAVAKMQRINRAFEQIRRAGLLRMAQDEDRPGPQDAQPADEPAAHPPRRPIHRKLKLTLEEAALGCIKVLRGKVTDACATCAGAGHLVLGGHCAHCGGSGAISRRSFFGWPAGVTECEACLGGGIARQLCPDCEGAGKTRPRSYTVKVRIPGGVRDGDLLHVGGSRSRKDLPPADLEIRVDIAPHAFFTLDDDRTLRCEVPVDGFAWIADRTVQVPTLEGARPLRLQRDTLSYRLRGQGFPIERRGARGDQWITVRPVFPDTLSTDQQILLDQLLATRSDAAGQPTDARLQAWRKIMQAWERGL